MLLNGLEREAVDLFWHLSGDREPFPRKLERPLALALPLPLVKLPRLRLWDVERWLNKRGNPFCFQCESRRVRGCLLAHAGHGLVFLDGADPEAEQRFTLAHEVAHFLVDYWLPRTKAIARFGPEIVDALDGRRPFTLTERVHALQIDAKIGLYQSFMDRSESSASDATWRVENRADRVALALLAPPDAVVPHLTHIGPIYSARLADATALLIGEFGLPTDIAADYARALLSSINKGPSWLESVGFR